MTSPTRLVPRRLVDDPARETRGPEIRSAAGPPSGTVLARLESRWEDVDPAERGRPKRRYHRLGGARRHRAR
ncbi:hypothetical protein [Umezawaea sp.]|uniref:hypothetical protein n=1 Tax=Umezawaea sp. TaxID=1955258 RepID=UPI002ED58FCD